MILLATPKTPIMIFRLASRSQGRGGMKGLRPTEGLGGEIHTIVTLHAERARMLRGPRLRQVILS